MRTTIKIDDELLARLKEQALRKRIPLTKLVNQILRGGLRTDRHTASQKHPYQEETHPLGPPRVDLTKAVALAAQFEDEESLRKMALRK
jgi:hypothetical protein